jgi:hypothetical protein
VNITLTLDGFHYLRMAEGLTVPSPYSRRWLLPRILGPYPRRWAALTWASLALTPAAAWCYFASRGIVGVQTIFAVVLLSALPGVWRAWRLPVLTDAPAFAMSLAVAALASRHPWLAALLSLPLGGMRESAPIFAAAWAWHPAPLVGLLAAGWFRKSSPPSPDEPWLAHPWREAWAMRRRIGPDPSLYLRPWGAALCGLVGAPWQVWAVVALAHAQLLVAVDAVRLAAWCAPVLVAQAAGVIPAVWWAVAVLVTVIQKDDRI